MSNNLQMSLKTKWFEMTDQDGKTEDYREITPYWVKRLLDYKKEPLWGINDFIREFEYHGNELGFIEKYAKQFTTNTMTLGYPSKSDLSKIKVFKHAGIEIREGREEWGAEKGKIYFVIKHGKRIS